MEIDLDSGEITNPEQDLAPLLEMQPNASKRCAYPGCAAQIPSDAEFKYCDTCRTLAARNAVAMVLDPIAPRELQRAAEVTSTLLLNMTGDEILQFHGRIERLYLEVCKAIKLHGISSTPKRPVKTLEEQIAEARAINDSGSIRAKQAKKKEKKKQTSTEKLASLLGITQDQAKRMMNADDFSDL